MFTGNLDVFHSQNDGSSGAVLFFKVYDRQCYRYAKNRIYIFLLYTAFHFMKSIISNCNRLLEDHIWYDNSLLHPSLVCISTSLITVSVEFNSGLDYHTTRDLLVFDCN